MAELAAQSPTPGKKVLASAIAEPFRAELRKVIHEQYNGVGPKLLGLLANKDPAAKKYAEWTGKACVKDGIQYELKEVTDTDLEDALTAANADPSVHGIIIYYPVFGSHPSFYGGSMDDYLRDSVSPTKDLEGLCHTYRHHMYHNIRHMDEEKSKKCILPCTPLAVVKILEHLGAYDFSLEEGSRLRGRTITVINRSEIVGRPLAAMLANDGADIYSADIDSMYLFKRGKLIHTDMTAEGACRASDVIITGVPTKSYKLPTEWVKPGTIVVNVASFKNVDEDELLQVPDVKYVSMVGKVTVAMLERNLLRLYQNYHAGEGWQPTSDGVVEAKAKAEAEAAGAEGRK